MYPRDWNDPCKPTKTNKMTNITLPKAIHLWVFKRTEAVRERQFFVWISKFE